MAYAQDFTLLAYWVATNESPEWIADRTDALLSALGSSSGITMWESADGLPWDGSPEQKADRVRAGVAEGAFGEPEPESGYSIAVLGQGPRLRFSVTVKAGSVGVGRRNPSHRLSVRITPVADPADVSSDVAERVCVAVAEIWRPVAMSLADVAVRQIARRGGWRFGIGYRTWVSHAVGTVTKLSDGLTSTPVADGTLISAPDHWPADRVVDAVSAALVANGLDIIPH